MMPAPQGSLCSPLCSDPTGLDHGEEAGDGVGEVARPVVISGRSP
jgi:hypothetical protein